MSGWAELQKGTDKICSLGLSFNQGPGGNVSLKHGNTLWIKPSGLKLDQIKDQKDLVPVDSSKVQRAVEQISPGSHDGEQRYSQALQEATLDSRLKPSMETGFHAVLPKSLVFHFHSLSAILMCHHLKETASETAYWLDLAFEHYGFKKPVILPCYMPGFVLSKALSSVSALSDIFLLTNHGVVLQDDTSGVVERFVTLEAAFKKKLQVSWPVPSELTHGRMNYYFPDMVVLRKRLLPLLEATSANEYRLTSNAFALDPDAIENWWATQMLQLVCPELSEVPSDILDRIEGLPTEIQRLKQLKTGFHS